MAVKVQVEVGSNVQQALDQDHRNPGWEGQDEDVQFGSHGSPGRWWNIFSVLVKELSDRTVLFHK